MGNLFIQNDHDFDFDKVYYCLCCSLNSQYIEIGYTTHFVDVIVNTLLNECLLFKWKMEMYS